MGCMTTQSARPVGFTAWYRDNPGHAVRALPISFAAFTVVALASFLIPGSSISATFVNASLAGCVAGLIHVGFRYLKTVYAAVSPQRAPDEPRGMTIMDVMVVLAIVPLGAMMLVWVLSVFTAR